MGEEKLKEVELLIKLIQVGQEGSTRPDLGTKVGSDGACNSTGIVRDAGYCKDHLKNIWTLLGSDEYFGFNGAIVRI